MSYKPLLIYLADDDPEDSMLFEEALTEIDSKICIETFDNGVTLMDALLNSQNALPDAIYLDLNMPLMNGEECVEDIRNEPKFSQIPIVIYSTYIDRAVAERLREKGANWYLIKPNTFRELRNLLGKSLDCVYTNLQKEADNHFIISATSR
ncbi:response regulator [Flavobacterium sp. ARAG 55.4]